MIARVTTFAIDGIESRRVWVEADIRSGLPAFTIVGLADKAIREARERVRSAIVNSGYEFPQKRITVNLAPAYLRKIGPGFDLPLAVAILVASDQLPQDAVEDCAIVGELSLTGDVRSIRGALAIAEGTRRHLLSRLLLPRARAQEAALVAGLTVLGIESLQEAVDVLAGRGEPPPPPELRGRAGGRAAARPRRRARPERADPGARGGGGRRPQRLPARPARDREDDARAPPAVDPAADDAGRGGRRHADPVGRPGWTAATAGSSRAARSARRTTRSRPPAWSAAASHPLPGEATLAHHGVLFLDELSEFVRSSLEALRQPLEDGHVTIVRGQQVVAFPTRFMLVAASNPCPCGMGEDACRCTAADLARHQRRLSGPLLDRIDILIPVGRPSRGRAARRVRAGVGRGARPRDRGARAPGAPPARSTAWPATRRCRRA